MTIPPPPVAPGPTASRRHALKLGLLGLGGMAMPLAAQEAGGSFTHGVASGEPQQDAVLLWTRYRAAAEVQLTWEMAASEDFARPLASGTVTASPERDHCAKVRAEALAPGTWYYYRFIAPNGETSCTGRTRTLPQGPTGRFRIAVFSCSNFAFGWFNAYAHAAEAADFDLAVHLGDYFYEYQRGEYPTAKEALGGRELWPAGETVALAEYRQRLATYRSDADLRRLHQLYPMVAMRDDHETANDTWKDGAENHQSATEGGWAVRKAASERAWREWMPVSDDDWARYDIGDLATLYRLETRHVARSEPLDLAKVLAGAKPGEAEAALAAFRDGAWRDPSRELLGTRQRAWLAADLRRSVRSGKPWQVLGQQIVMGSLAMPAVIGEGLSDKTPDWLRRRITAMLAASKAGIPLNMDAWDGYPAERERLYRAALDADANLLVLAGDSHNAWAFDLDHQGVRVGAEMAAHSVTSPGAEHSLPWVAPDALARASLERNPQLKWCDTARRGYLALELTPARATGEWRFMATVRERSTVLAGTHRMSVLAGERRLTA